MQDSGDLFIGKPLNVSQRQDDLVLLGKSLDRLMDDLSSQFFSEFLFLFHRVVFLEDRTFLDLIERQSFHSSCLSQKIPNMVDRYSVEPGSESGPELESREGIVGLDKCLLSQVVGCIPVAR